jgi:hypothetical protein
LAPPSTGIFSARAASAATLKFRTRNKSRPFCITNRQFCRRWKRWKMP